MISVWWDWHELIYYEMTQNNETVNAKLYAEQMKRLKDTIEMKRPHRRYSLIIQHDNSRPHVTNITKHAIKELR